MKSQSSSLLMSATKALRWKLSSLRKAGELMCKINCPLCTCTLSVYLAMGSPIMRGHSAMSLASNNLGFNLL